MRTASAAVLFVERGSVCVEAFRLDAADRVEYFVFMSNTENLKITSCTTLNNGVCLPWLGLGTYKTRDGEEVIQSVEAALEVGYRSIDTASFYGNEKGVGEAVRNSTVPRENVFLATKLWNDDQGYDSTLKAYDLSRKLLGVEKIDLYFIHWPVGKLYPESWRAMERLYRDGEVGAIGVSNFLSHHIETLLETAEVVPAVNQVEFHPLLLQPELLSYCREKGIQLQAWSPLTRGKHLDNPVLTEISEKHAKTPAQVILRWDLQHEVVTIPKSIRPERIQENADIFDFSLSPEEMERIDALDQGLRLGPDPDQFESHAFKPPR
jgi:methylglyoxal/glyoxal reductase